MFWLQFHNNYSVFVCFSSELLGKVLESEDVVSMVQVSAKVEAVEMLKPPRGTPVASPRS